MSDWQPMSTAPRDGRHLLLLLSADPGDAEIGFCDDEPEGWWWDRGLDRRLQPVRWMPIPEPPEALA